ncbi:MAG: ribosome assembly RNA-binding protein YhbY [Hydrogenophilaceae bacterium]|nr:ribosome assembly RNA-binding protein YhbY [Hydrogenophilaceae bacterium]
MITLTPAQRQYLKGLAHPLSPVVIIGEKGLTEAVIKEIDRALAAHELIKIKAGSDEKETRARWQAEICSTLDATPVQLIGKILVIYKQAKKPAIQLPR